MGIKIKNLQTGEFEKFNIPALKGEKGEPGEIEPSEKVDYIGKQHSKLRDTMNANVDYIIKTAIGEFNYLDYEGQHITATNSIEGHAKSAILKGQTLVNLTPKFNDDRWVKNGSGGLTINRTDDYIDIQVTSTGSAVIDFKDMTLFKENTEYTFIINVIENTFSNLYLNNFANSSQSLNVGYNKFKLTSKALTSNPYIRIGHTGTVTVGSKLKISNILVLEGDYTNVDVPYFTGMQSVKMPVLTTVGKNLFNFQGREEYCYYHSSNGLINPHASVDTYCVEVRQNTTYTITIEGRKSLFHITFWDKNLNFISGKSNNADVFQTTFTTPSKTCYVKFSYHRDGITSCQLEHGDTSTSYEPYKSSILSLPEEVVLRSLPNGVCDTFNTRTGVYTQRIGEVVLNGSEDWADRSIDVSSDTVITYSVIDLFNYGFQKTLIHCDKYATLIGVNGVRGAQGVGYGDKECLWLNHQHTGQSPYVYINIAKAKLSDTSLKTFKSYLQSNPVTVQYELATPVVKTVDLSDNHVYSYKGTTHYSCSSEEGSLVPTLSVKVPTDTQLTIQEQKATTQTLLIKNMDLQQSIKEVQAMNLAFNTALYNSFNSIREEVEDIKKHVSTNENLEGSF